MIETWNHLFSKLKDKLPKALNLNAHVFALTYYVHAIMAENNRRSAIVTLTRTLICCPYLFNIWTYFPQHTCYSLC